MPHPLRIAIVGAGLSGLSLAFRLQQRRPDAAIHVFESDARPGGKIWTDRNAGFQVEWGPNGFLDTKLSTVQLCRDLGLGERLIAASEASRKHRYLFLDGRLRELPRGPLGILTTGLLSWRGKLDLLREPFRARRVAEADESVGDFFRRRLGKEAAERFGDAIVTGIHAGDPDLLSIRAAFPRVAAMEAAHGSVIRGFLRASKERRAEAKARGEPPPKPGRMWSFHGGLRSLIEALVERLVSPPIYGAAIRRLERTSSGVWNLFADGRDAWEADVLVLTCPSPLQAALLAEFDSTLAADVASIAYARVAVVAVGYREADVPHRPDGFGFIAPQNTRRDLLGVQWCSAIFPDRAPPGCVMWRALCGGWNRPEVADWGDDRLLQAVRAELKLAHGVDAAPEFHRIVRWPQAIPQYHVDHLARVDRIMERAATHPGLWLAGNAYRGVAMNDCTEQAEILAHRIERAVASVAPSR